MSLDNWIAAVFLSRTVFTFESGPNGVELVNCSLHQSRVICKNACLKVPSAGTLHSYASAGQVGRSDICCLQVEDDNLEMHARTQGSFQSGQEHWLLVEILPEVRSGLFGVNQTDLLTFFD